MEIKDLIGALQFLQSHFDQTAPQQNQPQPQQQYTPEQIQKLEQTRKDAAVGSLLGLLANMVTSGYQGLNQAAQTAQGFSQNALLNTQLKLDQAKQQQKTQQQETQQQTTETKTPESADQQQQTALSTTESEDLIAKKEEEKAKTGNFTSAQLRWTV